MHCFEVKRADHDLSAASPGIQDHYRPASPHRLQSFGYGAAVGAIDCGHGVWYAMVACGVLKIRKRRMPCQGQVLHCKYAQNLSPPHTAVGQNVLAKQAHTCVAEK